MLKIVIHSTEVQTNEGVKEGRPWKMSRQEAWIFLYDKAGKPSPYPTRIELMLEHAKEDGAPLFHAPGEYTAHPSSIYVGRDGKLGFSPRLLKAPAATKSTT